MYKYGLNISDEEFNKLRKFFNRWLEEYRDCEYDEPDEDGEYEHYDMISNAYENGWDDIESVCEDIAETAYFIGFKKAFDMLSKKSRTMKTE